jgi:hypothetical protein
VRLSNDLQRRARRTFVVAWLALGLAGALDATIAERAFGDRVDLLLPHLKYGHVMFNQNPHQVRVYSYAGADGIRHDVAELVPTPAPGYKRARTALDVETKPDYLREICYRAVRTRGEFDFIVDEYDVDVNPRAPSRSQTVHCDAHGLSPR